ncbi:MAG: ubiquitin-like small modifier protein 1 [Sandaracinaceae bacterium]|nr:MAG: MoaD/ThiS family protein [Sandaracinaceae bacterium]HBQ11082.1 molybdopterin synthase sulfur carrier subunit [Myxococcales bacterium]
MAITVRIPTPLRNLTGGADEVSIEGGTVAQVIDNLEASHPGLKERLLDDKGVRRHVNIFANDEDIRFLDNLDTTLKDGDSVQIVPAIAGG